MACRLPTRWLLPLLLAATGASPLATAQDDHKDLRDRLVRRDGKELRGRLLTPHAADEWLLVQGGQRIRTARSDTTSTELVADRIREFCERRRALPDQQRALWFLVEWAAANQLPGLARAQAMLLALDHDHAEAHAFLGHKRNGRNYTWQIDGRSGTLEQIEAGMAKKPLELTGERFRVVADAGLRANVAALLDLEQLAVTMHEQFGKGLQLQESLRPIRIVCSRNSGEFEKWGQRPIPYFTPAPHGDVGRTFYAGPNPTRPELLFYVGAQALLYHCLIGELSPQNQRDRVCAWLEIGLPMWLQNRFEGPAGYAGPGQATGKDLLALQALGRDLTLTQLLLQPMYGGYYLGQDTQSTMRWSAATMFVEYLLASEQPPAVRENFLTYAQLALGERRGDSSSSFAKVMGQRIEQFEPEFTRWLAKLAGK